ncbi:hypothetical protein MRS76_15200 [Rhizobiaceae bacterium n13]|uniref:Uncharacterized protein n=1 Tax=Ferirhizobium litorale TaxID=2927786 RepID=A0AAE3U2R0_9HYPH|nr:hypothetical protein [Fererhizobium litorale]MDI7863304.1 hypothetical protein [Fererhizobium litorale]MDI7922962.1 hypothetical protein [Fererhizobium litorale]
MAISADRSRIAARGSLVSFGDRMLACWPRLDYLLLGALAWGGLMTLSAVVALYFTHHLTTFHMPSLVLLFFSGGLVGWVAALPFAGAVAHGRRPETRFAAFFLIISVGTIGITALLFAADFRLYSAPWNNPSGLLRGLLQFLFAALSAMYQFAVLGVRLYLPLGLFFLVITSLLLAKRMR